MTSFYPILLLTILVVIYGFVEYFNHQKILKSIPIRIHVNGTRGKSSVTRLIGAGLRAGGMKTVTKVTGTFPRLVLSDGTEVAIHRREKANIIEQLSIVKFCKEQNANVLIIECMALQPQYQEITENQMIKATIGVITNIRLDHLDVMGPTLDDVAKAIAGTIPTNAHLFTAEDRYFNYSKKIAEKNKTIAHQSKAETITAEEMKGFGYIEHEINVALALDICAHLGVDRKAALIEMKKTTPDEGVLTKSLVKVDRKELSFYNGFAANDPESTLLIWNSIVHQLNKDEQAIVVLNTRKDREDRARQLIEMIAEKLDFSIVALIGESCELVKTMALKNNIPENKIALIGKKPTAEVFEDLAKIVTAKATLVGIGNMGAGGAELVKYFEQKAKEI
jgi:poly-gamma-glutamate synthase PgsB/CapB